MRLLLFDVQLADPMVYGLVILSLVVGAALAMCGPVLTATRIDPVIALRTD